MARGTPLRAFRIDDDLWEQARARAATDGVSLSEVVRDALRRYVEAEQEPQSGDRLLRDDTVPEGL